MISRKKLRLPDSIFEELRDTSIQAGVKIMRFYKKKTKVTKKADNSPVTLADLEAHHYIVDRLKTFTPDIPIISEESSLPNHSTRKKWSTFWLVDPLDGTKEFISKTKEFTVNIALIHDGVPIAGVVYAPALRSLYYADKKIGSWKEVLGKKPKKIFINTKNRKPYRIAVSRSHLSKEMEALLPIMDDAICISVGSSLKFCWVAEGKADLYLRYGPTMEWDVAAGDCIYRYASKTKQNKSTITYNKKDLKNGYFAVGNLGLIKKRS